MEIRLALQLLITIHDWPSSLQRGIAKAVKLAVPVKGVPGVEIEMRDLSVKAKNLSAFSDPSGSFRVMQYNILAKALGDNREPWFLFGAGLEDYERAKVKKKHQERDTDTNLPVNVGFENYADDLSAEKQTLIKERNRKVFDWEGRNSGLSPRGRGERLAKEIAGTLSEIILLEEVDMFLDDADGAKGLFSMIDDFACKVVNLPEQFLKPKKYIKPSQPSGTRPYLLSNLETRIEGAIYSGYHARRGKSNDGVAILWRKDRFRLKGKDRREYSGGDRIFGMVLLEDFMTDKHLLAIATHLERNPEDERKEEVRRRQILELIAAMKTLSDDDQYDAVILAGDMNSDALEERWEVAVELLHHHAEVRIPPFAEVFEEEFLQYKQERKKSGLCTSRTEERNVLIDYIFYSPHSIHVTNKVGPEGCPDSAIPNEEHPSDHIPILANFAWGPVVNKTKWEVLRLRKEFDFLDTLIQSVPSRRKASLRNKFRKLNTVRLLA